MNQEQKIDQILSTVTVMEKKMEQTMRAVYGDEANGVPGLLKRQMKDEEDIHKLKDGRKKLGWILTGFVAAIQAIWFLFKEVFSK